jgi:hypothetical protein
MSNAIRKYPVKVLKRKRKEVDMRNTQLSNRKVDETAK